MRRATITFRLDSERRKALDAIAAGLDRDRSYVLNEAVRSYIEIYDWQVSHIQEGLRQAKAGRFAGESQVADAFARLTKGKNR
ncbi:MAG: ribbon-helix-helix protein, CopG family [Elusimicrobia bacterium]|nr:ribbon-helix-helix protein, CopG family [Elusimicrobiota bacterium]